MKFKNKKLIKETLNKDFRVYYTLKISLVDNAANQVFPSLFNSIRLIYSLSQVNCNRDWCVLTYNNVLIDMLKCIQIYAPFLMPLPAITVKSA